jgi:hypothetical protein
MGMGTYANHADTVEEQFVKEQCPETFQRLIHVLEQTNVTMKKFASAAQYHSEGDLHSDSVDENDVKKISDAYDAICKEFQEITGLGLEIRYHEAEEKGDEVDGVFWEVTGVYQLTPAGQKHKGNITRKFWTTWG